MRVVKKTSPLVDETDEDLLVIISMKDDPESSAKAFAEFHSRFKRFIYGMSIKITSNLPNSGELRDAVYQNTLINVHSYSGSFSAEGEIEKENVRRRIHGWLVKIAKNELLAMLRDQQPVIDPEELNKNYDKGVNPNEEKQNPQPSYNEDMVAEALKLLKDRDQHVFMTYWLYYEPGKSDQSKNLPRNVLDELATKYETTSENIRQIISRGKKKVFEYLEANYKQNRR